MLQVLKNHPAGLLSTALEVKVKEKCGAVPANFLSIIDGWGDVLDINPYVLLSSVYLSSCYG